MLSKSARQTQKIGEDFANKILADKKRRKKGKAVVIALVGDLGGGKTTFAQGLANGLGIKDKITSPTFVIMKRFGNFYHIDCYRIEKSKELLDLGFKEIIANPKNIIAIEWADRVKGLLPKNSIMIKFKLVGLNKRRIQIEAH